MLIYKYNLSVILNKLIFKIKTKHLTELAILVLKILKLHPMNLIQIVRNLHENQLHDYNRKLVNSIIVI